MNENKNRNPYVTTARLLDFYTGKKLSDRNVLIEEMASQILGHLGIRISLSGYWFIIESVMLTIMNMERHKGDTYITKDLYPDIAKTYKSTPERVERSIRHAITSIDTTDEMKYKYLGVVKRHYSNKEFIFSISYYIIRHLK